MSEEIQRLPNVQTLHIVRDPDTTGEQADEKHVVATGARLPSGLIVVEWRREAFEVGSRSAEPVHSMYESIDDAEQASGGRVRFQK